MFSLFPHLKHAERCIDDACPRGIGRQLGFRVLDDPLSDVFMRVP
jgi:hypothetical protein